MKTLTIINAVFCTLNILFFFAMPSSFGEAEVILIGVVFGLWCIAFAIISLVYVLKKEKTT